MNYSLSIKHLHDFDFFLSNLSLLSLHYRIFDKMITVDSPKISQALPKCQLMPVCKIWFVQKVCLYADIMPDCYSYILA